MVFSVKQKNNFAKSSTSSISKMELFVATVNSWKLLTDIASSLDQPLLNRDFQRAEKGCTNVASLAVYVDVGRPLFVSIANPKWNQGFNATI